MRPAKKLQGLTTLHWIVLGLVSTWEIGPPERLASEMGMEIADVEALCRDLVDRGWIQRVETH